MQIFHGTNADFDGLPTGPVTWWTENRERAALYGARIVERDFDGVVAETRSDTADGFLAELAELGVTIGDITLDDEYPEEPHMLLTGRRGERLAMALRAAGFDAVEHWECVEGEGEAIVLAIIEE